MHDNLSRTKADRRALARKVLWRLTFLGDGRRRRGDLRHIEPRAGGGRSRPADADQAIPTVELVNPERGTSAQHLVLPGEVQAWYSAPIYARVSGYVKMWYKDIGARVKAGDVLGGDRYARSRSAI